MRTAFTLVINQTEGTANHLMSYLPEPGVNARPKPSVVVSAVCTWCEYCRWPSNGAGNSCGLATEVTPTNK